jgi:gluconokinase
MNPKPASIVLMGVTGSGKSTIGTLLAEKLGWKFHDGDDYHPPANKDKMAGGTPLSDSDRTPWLENLNELLTGAQQKGHSIVLACSALKNSYRDVLQRDIKKLRFVHLDGSFECIQKRLSERKGHFMDPDLLHSQFDALELAEHAIRVPIEGTPKLIVDEIIQLLADTDS